MFALNWETASSVEWKFKGSQISNIERGETERDLGEAERICCVWSDLGGIKPCYLDTQRSVYFGGEREWWGQPTRPVFTQPWSQGQPVLFLDKSSDCSLSFSTCSLLFGPKWKALQHSALSPSLCHCVSLLLCVCVCHLSLSAELQLSTGTAGWCTLSLQTCSSL